MKPHQWKTVRGYGETVWLQSSWAQLMRQLLFQRTCQHSGFHVKINCCWETHVHEKSCTNINIQPYWASYVWTVMTGHVWRFTKVKNITCRTGSPTVDEGDLRIPIYVLDCIRSGDKTCVVISNDTDVIIALLFYVPVFLQEGLTKLCEGAQIGCWYLSSSYPLSMQDWVKIYAASFQHYSLTGYNITSKIGTKKQPSRLILSRPAPGLIFPNAKLFSVSGHLGNSILWEVKYSCDITAKSWETSVRIWYNSSNNHCSDSAGRKVSCML